MFGLSVAMLLLVTQYDWVCGASLTDVKKLSETLFSDYNSETRPVNDTESVVAITVVFNLVNLLELNQKDKNMVLNGLFQFSWTDESLTWNPSDYDETTYITVQQKRLWLPDVLLRNSVTSSRLSGQPDTPLSVTNQGKVNWNVMDTFTTSCDVDETFFPFDTQTCAISLSSFIHTSSEVNFLVASDVVKMESFHENGQWKVKSTSASTGTLATIPISEAKFELVLQRRSSYHVLTTIFPIVVLSLLTTITFLVPPDCGERLTLSAILFLSFIVFLLSLKDNIPLTAQNLPIVVIYAYLETTLAAIAIILSALVVRTNDKMDMNRVPRWLQAGARWFRTLFCWTRRKSPKWMFPTWRNHFIVNHWVNRKYQYPTSTEEQELDWVDVAEVMDRIFYLIFLSLTVFCAIICISLMVHRW